MVDKYYYVSIKGATDSRLVPKIIIYKNIRSGYTSPINGTMAYTKEMVIENEGYHTITLDSPVNLTPNEIFSVVVRYYNPNGTTYIPVEKNTPDGLVYTSRAGESFIDGKRPNAVVGILRRIRRSREEKPVGCDCEHRLEL